LLLAYPLHPAGKPEKLRDAHLAQIRMPVLCFNGTQDPLCRRDLMEKALEKLSWQMYWLEGATHSFRVKDLKEVTEVSRAWLSRLA
ncbi:MAG TPA: alpha/beta family hydrolase, partial [Burkholderiales bacterium]|nr:alpha/beta family hydrolase [Burkholderiales bacterium]